MLGDDLGQFFDVTEHAMTASVGGRSFPVIFAENFDPSYMTAMFDYTYERAGSKAESRSVTALAKTSDCLALVGASIVINAKTYAVQQIYPIEDGMLSTLILNQSYG